MIALMWLACAPAPEAVPPEAPAEAARGPKEHTVDCLGGADFPSVIDAVAAATSGDLITVAPCTYYGTVNLDGKSLRLVSTDGPEVTTIAASPGRSGLRVHEGEGPRTLVSGFTFTGATGTGAGVEVEMSSLRLENSIVRDTHGRNAIHGRSADLRLKGVTVIDNSSTQGSTVYLQRGALLMVDSHVTCGPDPTGIEADHGAFLVDRTTSECPGARAFFNEHSEGRLQRSVLRGGLDYDGEDGNDLMYVENTIVTGIFEVTGGTLTMKNSAVRGATMEFFSAGTSSSVKGSIFRDIPGCAIRGGNSFMTFSNNAFHNVGGRFCGPNLSDANNIDADCAHTDLDAGDWTLSPGSPCIDAGPAGGEKDVDGTRKDIGPHGGPFTQSGGW